MSYRKWTEMLLHGYSFTFADQDQNIRAWFSSWTGLEKVYVNDELVHSRRNLSFKPSASIFHINETEYAAKLDMMSVPIQCTLFKNGRKISNKKLSLR